MRKSIIGLYAGIVVSAMPTTAVATEITGKVNVENPIVVSLVDFNGTVSPTHINHLDSTYLIKIDVDKPEIMTFFLTYKDETGEKRQMYSPVLIKEEGSPILIDVEEINGVPEMKSEDVNQQVFFEFTNFLVDNFKYGKGDEELLPDKITEEINSLKDKTTESLVKDYLDLWGQSSRLSTERLIHMHSDLDIATKRKTMPKHKISANELIENRATKYFPEFVNIVAKEYGHGDSLIEKIENLRRNIPVGELLDHMESNLIGQYVKDKKGNTSPEELLAEIEIVGKSKPEYENWVASIQGYKSYLKRGDEAPEDKLYAADGTEFQLSDFKGKYIFIDFWASWCTYCIKEFPALEKVKDEFTGSDIQFIGISLDEDISNWKKALEKYNLNDTQLVVSSPELAGKLGLSSIPRYMIYDRDGKLLYAETPRPRQTDKLIELLKSLV